MAVIWDSPKWPVKIMECLTVRSLEIRSLVKSKLIWQFWVRIFLYYVLKTHFYSIAIVFAWLPTVRNLHNCYVGDAPCSLNLLKPELYVTQCLHLHLCVKFHLRWRRPKEPPWPAMMLLAHLRPLTSGTKTASFFQLTPARSLGSRTPPTFWTLALAAWFVTSSSTFNESVWHHWKI